MLTLQLSLTNRWCLVVGAGPVGLRKVETILRAGGSVRLVDPKPIELPFLQAVERIQSIYLSQHLDGMDLVFAAATPMINEQVVADAKARRILVSSVSAPESGDFVLPATVQQGDLSISVSTNGTAPALAQTLCQEFASQFDESWVEWLAELKQFRQLGRQQLAPRDRVHFFREISNREWLTVLQQEGVEALRVQWLSLLQSFRGS